ncbi:1-acyl-sn-glycerol-3-phosphate acyltransferase [Burkholderia sp. WAC0059]|uniref:lysophospholipid acyltransferase family protein n=1 Tax=Burkholderia sp. WAC0059 TaxID=2066022 RepID=UPI000C7EB65C|nr:lysophospholipid acyltransferase family protein [Burkholderia sp. WAC0059]PLZ04286.1 1-acyl-sn-glycerol-3-phosphate acyltransferase [Burkholderia sp. WAC0059]
MTRLDYGWRFVATGLSFAAFGLCGVLFSVFVFPFALCWPHEASRCRAVTALIHGFFRVLVAILQTIGVMTLETSGVAALRERRPAIVVANHPTYLDVMVLLALTPSACCVVKSTHWRNPCFWGIVRAARYVSNADPLELVEAGSRRLESGYTVIVFPEGTRSPEPNRLHAFSRGFAHMALKADATILPVLMDCDPPVFTRQRRWYHVPPRAFRMRVKVLEPIGVARLAAREAAPALAARTVTNAIEAHMIRHLFDHGFFKTGN